MIYFLGDVHGNFRHVIDAVRRDKPDAVVFLGDVQAQRPLHIEIAEILDLTQVWWIPGNHDTDSDADYDNLFGSELADRNLHGRVVEIAGLRVAGLGGVFRGQIWMPPAPPAYDSQAEFVRRCGKGNRWRGGLPRKHRSTIFESDWLRLATQRADILVTHEAPGCHPHGFEAINEVASCMQVSRTFHGHQHDNLDYSSQFSRLSHQAHGVGFCGITDQDGKVIRPGDFDQNRSARQGHIFGDAE